MLGYKQWQGGKGDRNRVGDKDKFNENFDLIFKSKSKPKPKADEKPKEDAASSKPKVPLTWLY